MLPFAPLGYRFVQASPRSAMPMDAYRRNGQLFVHFDMPGMDPATIDLTVEKNIVTVSGERRFAKAEGDKVLVAERPQGRFSCRLDLGDNLDPEGIEAGYEHGVLTLTVPVAENAKARKISVTSGSAAPAIETEAETEAQAA